MGKIMVSEKNSIAVALKRLSWRRFRIVFNILVTFFLTEYCPFALADGNVSFEKLGGDQCFMFSLLVPHQMEGDNTVEMPLKIVVDSEESYRKLLDPKILKQSCASDDIEQMISKVDFSTKTVLGLWGSGECYDTDFKKSVWRDDQRKSLTYSISAIGSASACMGPGLQSLNLIAIPKIPPGYKIVFENVPK
jgi:hypothetical protein